ncbi:MAG: Rrf2 family transcriptional regulator [Candidatus Curtissbacteria bacterium]|nr:Rrf2 family transcriptional regulator [Candidatus Curtissbacteria bacterium]
MFRLTTKSDYGLILLSNLSRSKKLVSISSVAKKNKISPKFLSQIAQELKKAGYISSKEGARGGYRLAKPAQDIKILDVLKTLDGEIVRGECFEDDHECHCGGKKMFAQMKKEIEATMAKKTVADLVS